MNIKEARETYSMLSKINSSGEEYFKAVGFIECFDKMECLLKALEAIRKHQEIMHGDLVKFSAIYRISIDALEEYKRREI